MGFLSILFLILLTLKLLGMISLSWGWLIAILIGDILLLIGILIIGVTGYGIISGMKNLYKNLRGNPDDN